MSARQAGFSLLELLVALVVLGLLMAGLTQGIRFGFSAWGMQARIAAGTGDLDAVDRALRRLLEQARPSPDGVAPALVGTASSLALTTALPVAVDAPTHEGDISLRVDDRHRLVLDWLPHLHATSIGAPRKPVEDVLLEGIDALEIGYFGKAGWVKNWSAPALPTLIHLHLRFPKGDLRAWPDLVATPLRDGS